jgi:ATP-binding protein involved in chromosome partitioning
LREWRDGPSDQGADHREAARGHRPGAAPLDRRARHGALDRVQESGRVEVVVSLTTAGCPIRSHFEQAVAQQVGELDGVTEVAVGFDVLSDQEKGQLQQSPRPRQAARGRAGEGEERDLRLLRQGRRRQVDDDRQPRRGALTAEGHPAGALDCDVYGYSIPRMLGVDRKPEVNGERKILPLEAAGGVKVMSIGFFVEENAGVVWRGPMLHKAIQQFLEDVAWGRAGVPAARTCRPGTGDVSMTLAQLLPQASS